MADCSANVCGAAAMIPPSKMNADARAHRHLRADAGHGKFDLFIFAVVEKKPLVMLRRHNTSLAKVGWIDRAGDGAVHVTNIDPRWTKEGRWCFCSASSREDTLPRVRLGVDGCSHNGIGCRWSRCDGCADYWNHPVARNFFPDDFLAAGTVRS